MAALHEMGVAELGRALAAKDISSVELTTHLLARLAEHQQLGVLLSSDDTLALAQAHAADARRASGEHGPLLGVPLAHKDIFVTADLPTTAGSKILSDYRSPFDATVVARLAAAGTVTTSLRWVRPTKTPPSVSSATRGTRTACQAVRPVARPPRWPLGCCLRPPVPTPAARFGSRPASPASRASSRPTACVRASA
jgi:hypothetical protein